MRIIVQRVLQASVEVEGKVISEIAGKGLLALVGISREDSWVDTEYLARKLVDLRLWPDETGTPWKKGARALDYEVLLVSQFTLYAVTSKGNKPDFRRAMAPDEARELYHSFVDEVRSLLSSPDKVKDGEFGAKMVVSLKNDGPVTVELNSEDYRNANGERLRAKAERRK